MSAIHNSWKYSKLHILALATALMISGMQYVCAQTQPEQETYVIIGIASGDTLNVRRGPGADNPIVARLENGASPIKITGGPVMNGTDDWVFVSFPGGTGWVRPKYLSLQDKPFSETNDVQPGEFYKMLRDCRDDSTRHNATHAVTYFAQNPSTHNTLWKMYNSMDAQGRDIILSVLCDSEEFKPSQQFIDIVFDRATKDDNEPHEFFSPRAGAQQLLSAHIREAARYVPGFITSDDFEEQYCALEAIVRNDLWLKYERLYTPQLLRRIALDLRNDQSVGNAIDATSFFTLLGAPGAPILREVSQWSDPQAQTIASNILVFLKGEISEDELDARLSPVIHTNRR